MHDRFGMRVAVDQTMECKLDKPYGSNLCKHSSDRKSFLGMVKY